MKRLFFVAGESSGDMHGAGLIRALRSQEPELICEGLGGHLMEAEGMALRHDLASDAIMGFTEVVKHLLPIRRLLLDTVEHLRQTRPAALVLIDYPGFNIRLAKRAHALGIPVLYYISPQVWAWKKGRIHTLARCVSKMLVIFPFEEVLYRKVGLDCRFVGHPLLDHVAAHQRTRDGDGPMIIGLFPGSRAQEIERLLGPMLATARSILERYPEARFATPVVNERRADLVRALAGNFPLDIRVGGMYDVLNAARFCLVASGTATLETALFGVPLVIVYRVTPLTFWLARWLVDIEHIGIVNILAGRRIIPEFIQHDAVAEKI
ncbi:MAG: lipid-A-disaccharide synthase, partial [Candidatus Hydrogenedentes bacterium]|nr:lipid-A-disaccharide synthase [Candidatus Hydrogenedentota bacterium]